ncbi:MAG: nuclear transport factor 2 family protein [Pseudomonadota bacterium]
MKLAIALIFSFLSVQASAATPREALDAFHKALTAGDKEAAIELLSPTVLVYESGYVERSRAEYASHHLDGDIAFSKTAVRKVLKQGERVEGKTAVLWQETETTGSSKGKEVHSLGTETAVMEKVGDRWTIVHVHWSSRKAK